MKFIYGLILICALLGCGRNAEQVSNKSQSLSVEEWKTLEIFEKYEPETFDRLKLYKPELADEENWEDFMRTVIVPERRKDIPTDY